MTKKLTELQKTIGSILILGIVSAAIVLLLGFFPIDRAIAPTGEAQGNAATQLVGETVTISYSCADDRSFVARIELKPEATYENPGHAELLGSDGSTLLLTQAIAASGARYTNEDESIVYWIKGSGSFIQQNGETVYADCEGTEV
ncbi:MliC family protein [Patescibacteria group bacterium]|nr:MliC family protein [Patescibacteria group bacterium]MBU1754864.1 MliC family protein [Patescibacteria group bacterium]